MHQYGETKVQVHRARGSFRIVFENHVSGTQMTLSGPTRGILEDPDREVSELAVQFLGDELAHFLRERLSLVELEKRQLLTREEGEEEEEEDEFDSMTE